eukprot:2119635-Pleurochrysis_carterae.AAC.2
MARAQPANSLPLSEGKAAAAWRRHVNVEANAVACVCVGTTNYPSQARANLRCGQTAKEFDCGEPQEGASDE